MPTLPVSVTRTSEFLTNRRLTAQVNKNAADLQNLYNQLSTGRRLEHASDDAPAATRASIMQRSLQYSEQLIRNSKASQRFLDSTDSLLADVGDSLIETRASANAAAQSTISDEERKNLADNIQLSIEQIVRDSNRTFEGHSLLSGAKGGTPLANANEFVRLRANETLLESFQSSGETAPQSSNVFNAFGFGANQIRSSAELRPNISNATFLADLSGGAGIEVGPLRIFDSGPGIWKTVDLTGSRTVGELIQRVETTQVEGRSLRVSILPDRLALDFADGLPGTLSVKDIFGSETAKSIGWLNRGGLQAPPIANRNLTPLLGIHSKISELAGGAGVDLSAGVQVRQGKETFAIDLSNAETVGDILVAFNRSDADVHASIDSKTGQLVLQSLRNGVDFSVGENGGAAAESLGIRSGNLTTRLDKLLQGRGVQLTTGPDFWIARSDGTELAIDLDGATDLQDVVDSINNQVDNVGPQAVTVSLSTIGNSLVLDSVAGSGPLVVRSHEASNVATALGLVPKGSLTRTVQPIAGTINFTGDDFSGREPGGILDDLIRLKAAVRQSDFGEIARLQANVDAGTEKVANVRAELGIHTQAAAATQTRLEDDNVALKQGISDNLDADLTEVISQVSLRQAAMQASLQIMGKMSGITLLDYL